MPFLSSDVLAWLRDHHGVISTHRLRELGVSRSTWQALVRHGALITIHKGVYRIASAPPSLAADALAICLARPSGFVTGPTAGRLCGLRRMPSGADVHFCTPHGMEFDSPGVVLRQSCRVERTDIQTRSDGTRIASPWRLAFDLAADLAAEDHQSVIEQILHRRLCTMTTLVATARRLVHPARPGSELFVETLTGRLPGGPLESHPEVELARILRARGVPVHAQTTWLVLPDGGRARLDLSIHMIRWGIEIDVHPDHLLLEGTTRDKRRDRQAARLGWLITRVTPLDLLDLHGLADELTEIYRCRQLELGQRPSPLA